jgi:hypothetical protein
VQVLLEYLQIWDRTREVQLLENQPNKIFSTASAYSAFFIGQHPIEGAKLLRKTRALAKCKFFIWLVLHERCWTAARRKRHGLQDDDSCALCAQSSETIDHLLVACHFRGKSGSRSCARSVGIRRCFMYQLIFSQLGGWTKARKQIPKTYRRGFDSLVVLVCWLIWKERNHKTFDHRTRTIEEVMYLVIEEITAWPRAGYRHLDLALASSLALLGRTSTIM